MKNKIKFDTISIGIIFLSLAILIISKAIYVDDFLFYYTSVRFLGGVMVIINDAVIYLAIIILFYLSYLNKMPHVVAIILRSMAFFLLIVYVMDYFVITNFSTHLTITDVSKYASYSLKYIQQTHGSIIVKILSLLALFMAFSVFVIFRNYRIKNKLSHLIFRASIVVLFVISTVSYGVDDKYVHSWIYKNVINHNIVILSERRQYSEDFIANLFYEEKFECLPQVSENLENIILLMVESLSSYQSDYFSGINNWTPNLDAIAKKNIAYNNFYANGFTTEDGEISLLTGKLPIYKPSSYSNGGGKSFNGFFNIQNSLPNIFKRNGYITEFLTTADLDFAKTGNWARSIGFDYIEGHEHAYYEDMERFHFNAAPDKALYNRLIERIRNNGNKKHFYFIKTVSTHHPFINPETRNQSEAEAFKYADMQLGKFYKKLIDMDFFDKGMLMIVGDHHAMVPLKNKEIKKYGSAKASATIPLIVSYGDKIQYLDSQQYQQVGVFNSLKGLVLGTQHYSNWVGNIFTSTPAKYIAHRRGDNRNIITVISNEVVVTVKLDGDDTRIISEYPENILTKKAKNEILNKINSVRIVRSNTTSNKTNCHKITNL